MANLDYNDFRPCNCVWRMVLPTNSLKLLGFLTEEWHLATPATPLAPPGARASTSSDRSTAAPAASFNPVPLQTAKVVLVPQRLDCVAEHVRPRLRNVVAKYPFERSHTFPVIEPKSGGRDYSRSSCDRGRRSSGLVPGSRQDACACRNCRPCLKSDHFFRGGSGGSYVRRYSSGSLTT